MFQKFEQTQNANTKYTIPWVQTVALLTSLVLVNNVPSHVKI